MPFLSAQPRGWHYTLLMTGNYSSKVLRSIGRWKRVARCGHSYPIRAGKRAAPLSWRRRDAGAENAGYSAEESAHDLLEPHVRAVANPPKAGAHREPKPRPPPRLEEEGLRTVAEQVGEMPQ